MSYTKSGSSGKISITFDAADKPTVIEAEKENLGTWLAEEIRKLGFFAYVDNNKLTVVHEDANDSLEIALTSKQFFQQVRQTPGENHAIADIKELTLFTSESQAGMRETVFYKLDFTQPYIKQFRIPMKRQVD